MAKEHISQKIKELKDVDAEKLINQVLEALNVEFESQDSKIIKVVLNLADDMKGGWTNHYTADFDSKFKLNALVTRNFCTPHIWSSENYNETLVKQRAQEYVYRTIYWLTNSKLNTLEDYLKQEIYVCQRTGKNPKPKVMEKCDFIEQFYRENREQDDYSMLFNFFYGDIASKSLNYPAYGIRDINGYEYAALLANKGK